MRISDWSSDVCSSDLAGLAAGGRAAADREPRGGAGAAVGAGAGIGRDRAGRDGLFALAGTAPALAARRRQRARRTPLAQPLPAAPVRGRDAGDVGVGLARVRAGTGAVGTAGRRGDAVRALVQAVAACRVRRSEERTSELQSLMRSSS